MEIDLHDVFGVIEEVEEVSSISNVEVVAKQPRLKGTSHPDKNKLIYSSV